MRTSSAFITGQSDPAIRRPWPLELVNSTPFDPVATRAYVDELRHAWAKGPPPLPAIWDHGPKTTLRAPLAPAGRAGACKYVGRHPGQRDSCEAFLVLRATDRVLEK